MPDFLNLSEGGRISEGATTRDKVAFEDERGPATAGRQGALSKPDFDYTNIGLLFPNGDDTEKLYYADQLPHSTRIGTIFISPHIHYLQDESDVPTFKLDYRFYNNGEAVPSFTTISTDDGGGVVFTYSSGTILQILPFPDVAVEGVEPSMWYDMILYRDDSLVTGDVLVKSFDFHRPVDTLGSSTEYTK